MRERLFVYTFLCESGAECVWVSVCDSVCVFECGSVCVRVSDILWDFVSGCQHVFVHV